MATIAPVSYFKRYKMEVDLGDLPLPELPPGYRLVPWAEASLEGHAEALFDSFHQEIDSVVFPSLGDRGGCLCLMTALGRKRGFLPEATWLLAGPAGPCGSVQGVREFGA